jgi:hypothetical protein
VLLSESYLQVGKPVVVIVEDEDMVPAFTSYTAADAGQGRQLDRTAAHPNSHSSPWNSAQAVCNALDESQPASRAGVADCLLSIPRRSMGIWARH